MSDGVFATVPCALSVAYRMPAYRKSPESTCARILRDHIRRSKIWDIGDMLPKVVFFEGLTNDEIHAQCALIRAVVIARLPELEAATIRARYGLTDFEDLESGARRFAFSADRADAIKALSDRMREQFDVLTEGECDILVARIFANVKATTPITLRAIAEQFGRSHVHYYNYFHVLDDTLFHFEMRALDTLTDIFAERGTCNGEPIVAAHEHYASGQ
jgi:hypothetical protein